MFGNPFTVQGFSDWSRTHNTTSVTDIFIEFDTPIFILRRKPLAGNHELLINPCLQDFGAQSIFDPWTAYQEIDMFLGNVLTNRENSSIVRSEELIRDSKGFDEWSFKQRGSKKRKRR